jgi:hypothetical protein
MNENAGQNAQKAARQSIHMSFRKEMLIWLGGGGGPFVGVGLL